MAERDHRRSLRKRFKELRAKRATFDKKVRKRGSIVLTFAFLIFWFGATVGPSIVADDPDAILLETDDNGGNPTKRFKISAGSTTAHAVFENSRVGIGTSNPSRPLEVSSSSDDIITFQETDGDWPYSQWIDSSGTRRTWMGLDGNQSDFRITTENGTSSIHLNAGRVNLSSGNIDNRGNYWWGRVSLDNGGWVTSDGNSGDISVPGGGSTNCDSNDNVCLYNTGSGEMVYQFEIPDRYTSNWSDGSGSGGMCWTATTGDNEYRGSEIWDGVRNTSSDTNGHCLGDISNCAGGTSTNLDSHAIYAVICWDPE